MPIYFNEKVTFAVPVTALFIDARHSGQAPKVMYKDNIVGEIKGVFYQMDEKSVAVGRPRVESILVEVRTTPTLAHNLMPNKNKAVRLRVFLVECEIADIIPGINPWHEQEEIG